MHRIRETCTLYEVYCLALHFNDQVNLLHFLVSSVTNDQRTIENLFCQGPPVLWPNASNLIVYDINEHDPIDLHCPVTNAVDLSIQWSKNNEDIDSMWSSDNLSIKRLQLKIVHAQITDAGLYQCNVVNGFGSVQAQFRVNIKRKSNRFQFHV
jgi:hypothetical protein